MQDGDGVAGSGRQSQGDSVWIFETAFSVPLVTLLATALVIAALVAGLVYMVRANRSLRNRSETDHLTGLPNRTLLDALLTREVYRMERSTQPFSVAMMDIDHFKAINDKFGHPRGDRVLIEMARAFYGSTRRSDVIGRWGGEEFLLILPGTDLPHAFAACERIRQRIERRRFAGSIGTVTISAGIAQAIAGETADALIWRADAALYRAKNAGRNRCIADDTVILPAPRDPSGPESAEAL